MELFGTKMLVSSMKSRWLVQFDLSWLVLIRPVTISRLWHNYAIIMAKLSVDKFLEICNSRTNALWQVDVPHGISWKPPAMGAFPSLDINFPKPNAYPIKSLAYFLPKNIRHQLAECSLINTLNAVID